MNLDAFWAEIDSQIARLKTAKTVTDVMKTCPSPHGYNPDVGFFGGSGGDDSVYESLRDAGWSVAWIEADYFYCLRSPDGTEYLTYIEGDLQRGNNQPLPHNEPEPAPATWDSTCEHCSQPVRPSVGLSWKHIATDEVYCATNDGNTAAPTVLTVEQVGTGAMACCRSIIGPPCQHRTVKE